MAITKLEKVQPGLFGGWGTDKPVVFNGGLTVAGGFSSTTGLLSASPTAGVGYSTGAGGTVTQGAGRTTGVTLNKITGSVQTDVASLAAATVASFVVTNSAVAVSDVVTVAIRSGANSGNTLAYVSAVAAGSFTISVYNATAATAETGAIVINFAVIKAVTV